MSVVFILFPLALLIAAAAVVAFIWAAKSGQFDDLDTPQVRLLHDDEQPTPPDRSTPDSEEPPPDS